MSVCTNCKSKLTCGCQKRTASNGTAVCSMCLVHYEAALKKNTTQPKNATAPSIVSVLYTKPVSNNNT
jgi:hypothetical protein